MESEFERCGHMPLPPYLGRTDEALDRDRYQTVFASASGAVAAPTAGLHFTEAVLSRLKESGTEIATITLHTGLGTFQPVRVDDLDNHAMHREAYSVSEKTAQAVRDARKAGRDIVAVGTTVVRALESAAAASGELRATEGETELLIQPGYRFHVVDALLTNFHLPKSTLLALVFAFAGRDRVLCAYRTAIEQGYRFFSYGDAMFVSKRSSL